jgi:hypothetical protein
MLKIRPAVVVVLSKEGKGILRQLGTPSHASLGQRITLISFSSVRPPIHLRHLILANLLPELVQGQVVGLEDLGGMGENYWREFGENFGENWERWRSLERICRG